MSAEHAPTPTQQPVEAQPLEHLLRVRADYAADGEYIAEQIAAIDAQLIDRLGVGTHDVGGQKVQVREYSRTDYAALAATYPAESYPELYETKTELSQAAVKKGFAPAALDQFKVTGKKSVSVK